MSKHEAKYECVCKFCRLNFLGCRKWSSVCEKCKITSKDCKCGCGEKVVGTAIYKVGHRAKDIVSDKMVVTRKNSRRIARSWICITWVYICKEVR